MTDNERAIKRIRAKWPQAVPLFERVLKEAAKTLDVSFRSHGQKRAAIRKVAKKFGDLAWDCGGGGVVGYILVDRQTYIGVTDECVVVYHDPEPSVEKKDKDALYELAMKRDFEEPEYEAVWLTKAGGKL